MAENKKPDTKPKKAKPKKTVNVKPGVEKGKGSPDLKFKRTSDTIKAQLQKEAFTGYLKSVNHFEVVRARSIAKLKLNEQIIKQYCIEIVKGHYPEVAAKLVGVSYRTVGEWLYKGRQDAERIDQLMQQGVEIRDKDISIFHTFFLSVQKALHMAEDRDLMKINIAADIGLWQAAAWKMERRHNSRWGKKDKLDANISGQVSHNVQHVIMTPDEAPSIEEWQKRREADQAKTIEHFKQLPLDVAQVASGFDNIMDS